MGRISWNKYNLLLGLFFVFFSGKVFSQDVKIENVSVSENGHVKVEWKFSGFSANIDPGLYRDEFIGPCYSYSQDPIYKIPDTSHTSYIDSTVSFSRVRSYQISKTDIDLTSNKFNTIHANLNLDTCQKEIRLEWSRSYNQQPQSCPEEMNDTISIEQYNIWRSTDGGAHYTKIGSINRDPEDPRIDTTFTDPDIEYDRTYRYYIEGVLQSDTSIKSKSNRVSINTEMPDDPQYINLDSLSTRNRNIHLSFSIDKDSELNRYVLLRSQGNPTGRYDTLKVFSKSASSIQYVDESVDPTRNLYYYHLAAVNQCGALTTRSDTLSNMLLTVSQQNLIHTLAWSEFLHLQGSNISYQIYRKGGKGDFYDLLATDYSPPYPDNDVETYRGRDVSSEFCYYIVARIDHSNDMQSFVTSYKRCVYVKPRIFIPNAFTPNEDGQNDSFQPVFTFIPQHYLFIVYNRSGEKVFESQNHQQAWKGRIRGGKKAPAGTYTYFLEVKNPGQPVIRKRGEINLLYP